MNRLRIVHKTSFEYEGQATASYNEIRMQPINSDRQWLISSNTRVSEECTMHTYTDYFGSKVTSFDVLSKHDHLEIVTTNLVEVRDSIPPSEQLQWSALHEIAAANVSTVEQLMQTSRTAPPDEVAELARNLAAETATPTEAVYAIMAEIGRVISYEPGATGVHTSAAEAWLKKKGVCQDITHIALGALRSIGIPARYVSGYLHPQAEPVSHETVIGESHAWLEWFDGGWRGYDPTNSIEIGDRHVLVGRGRDYQDVSPLKGVYSGPTKSNIKVTVEITKAA